jgi:hypothetical protein
LQIVLCVVLEAVCGSPIEASYGAPLAPVQTITIPEGPALLTAPTTIRVVASHPFVAQPTFIQAVHAPFIQTVAGPVEAAQFALPAPVVHHAAPLAVAAPVVHHVAPVPVAAPAALPVLSAPTVQHHAQDEFGGFNFGYQDINSAKEEIHTPDGVTRGSYSYVDANGLIQRVDYIADPINGFRVAGTNIPVAPGAPAAVLPVGPAPVEDTPEVAAAKAEFLMAFAEAEAAAAVAEATTVAPEESD